MFIKWSIGVSGPEASSFTKPSNLGMKERRQNYRKQSLMPVLEERTW